MTASAWDKKYRPRGRKKPPPKTKGGMNMLGRKKVKKEKVAEAVEPAQVDVIVGGPPLGKACANPDCGHDAEHHHGGVADHCNKTDCKCDAYVATEID